jgi:hypothetical protein
MHKSRVGTYVNRKWSSVVTGSPAHDMSFTEASRGCIQVLYNPTCLGGKQERRVRNVMVVLCAVVLAEEEP